MNYFELFELPESFFPDKMEVRNTYYRLSRLYHPDLQQGLDDGEAEEILKKSSLLNEGYRNLNRFDLLVPYLLEVKGIMEPGEKYALDNAFLMEMMEANEQLMDAKMSENEEELHAAMNTLAALEKEIQDKL